MHEATKDKLFCLNYPGQMWSHFIKSKLRRFFKIIIGRSDVFGSSCGGGDGNIVANSQVFCMLFMTFLLVLML